jgi:hypothetical protein
MLSLRIKRLHKILNSPPLLHRWPESTVLACVRVSRPGTPRYRLPSLGRPHVDRLRALPRPWIDSYINGRIQAICNCLSDETDFHDWVVATLLSHVEKGVLSIGSLHLLVGVVRSCLLDLTEEVLLNIELSDVRDCATLDSVVGQEFSAVVNDGWVWLVIGTSLC